MVIDLFGVPDARNYDQEADSALSQFKKAHSCDESEMTDDDGDVIIRNENGLVVAMIFLNAIRRRKAIWPDRIFLRRI
jgi:hypothetical protein